MKNILIIQGGGRPKGNTAQLWNILSKEQKRQDIK